MAFRVDEPPAEICADFALMQTAKGALERYWRLAVETSEYQRRLKDAGIFEYPKWVGVDEAAKAIHYIAQHVPTEYHDYALFARCKNWAKEFDEIYHASPKWRLKKMISDVSETHELVSWPNRWEREIWNWAMSDDSNSACPFDDRRDYIDPLFRQHLHGLISEVNGFLYRCEETSHIVFAPAEDLDKIWRHQDHLAEIDRNKLFGFFHDASRPNFTMRAPTEEEDRLMATFRARSAAQRGWRARLIHYFKHWLR